MADRDEFTEGFRGSGWNKYSPGYRSGALLKQAMTYTPPEKPKPAPAIYPSAAPQSVSYGPVVPSMTTTAQPVGLGNTVSYGSSGSGRRRNTIFQADWWLDQGPLGSLVRVGETLKASRLARILCAVLCGGLNAFATYGHKSSDIVIVYSLVAIFCGSYLSIAFGWMLENVSKAVGHLMAYASIAVACALVLGGVLGVGYLARSALSHRPPIAAKTATIRPPATSTQQARTKHRQKNGPDLFGLAAESSRDQKGQGTTPAQGTPLAAARASTWDSVASLKPRRNTAF